jgi:sugar lactone lactonase YvrE
MVRVLTLIAFLALAAPAAAVDDCADTQPAKTLLSGQGLMESVIGGPDGRLYYTDTDKNALMRLDAPTAKPAVLSDGITAPGGLLVGTDRRSIVQGYGDGIQQGASSPLMRQAGLLRIDLATGKQSTIATGLSMANGLARDPAGAVYASNDVVGGVDRVVGSEVDENWAGVASANGMAVSANARYLFVNQTFQPAAIQRVTLANPADVQQYAAPGPEDITAGLDGLTIDQDDRLFAAANQSGEVWRIGTDGAICALARGLNRPSAVAFGTGGEFPVTSLYVVTFGGTLSEIPAARSAPTPGLDASAHLRLRVRPRLLRAGRRTRVRIRVHRGTEVEAGAFVRVGPRSTRTGPRGRARVSIRPRRKGFVRIRVRAAGVPVARARIRVLERKPRPQAVTEP